MPRTVEFGGAGPVTEKRCKIHQLTSPVVAGAALVGLLTLGACSGGAATPSPTDAAVTRTTGPLDEFFGGPDADLSAEEMAAQERKVQESVVACMAAEGFEYRPWVMTAPSSTEYPDSTTRDFAEKYGYGISTFSIDPDPTVQPTDPNQAIVEAMSAAEREAYEAALYGAPVFASESGAAEPTAMPTPDPEDLGCFGKAQQEIYGAGQVWSNEFDDLFNRMSELYEKVDDDPAVAQALDRWRTCMADAGHPGLSSVNDPIQQISDRMNEFFTSAPGASPAPVPTDATGELDEPGYTGPDPDDPALIQLRADEIALAVADFDCRQSSGYRAAFDAVSLTLQEQFVQDNRAELERYRDAAGGGG